MLSETKSQQKRHTMSEYQLQVKIIYAVAFTGSLANCWLQTGLFAHARF